MTKHLVITDKSIGWPDEIVVGRDLPINASDEIIDGYLSKIPLLNFKGFKKIIHNKESANDLNKLADRLNQLYILQNTNVRDSSAWADAIFANIKHLYNAPGAVVLSNRLRGDVPVIFCAAGPSLDKAYDFIRAAVGKACIVAVNTAAGALWKNGILPDIVLAADYRYTTYLGVKSLPVDSVLLACSWQANDLIPEKFAKRVTWTNNNHITNTLYELLGKKNTTQLTERGSVVGCGYDLIDILNPSEVFIIGQDLTSGYSAHTFYAELGESMRNDSEPMYPVACNDGETRIATATFSTYIGTVNECLRTWSRPTYNLSLEGAMYEKAAYMSIADAIAKIERAPAVRYDLSFENDNVDLRKIEKISEWMTALKQICEQHNYPPARLAKKIDAHLASNISLTKMLFSAGFRAAVLDAKPRGKDGITIEYINILKKEACDYIKRIRKAIV